MDDWNYYIIIMTEIYKYFGRKSEKSKKINYSFYFFNKEETKKNIRKIQI